MPILHNNSPLFRIKFKDANIREVRRGNELEWGLYHIEYNQGIPVWMDETNITEYVWGYPDLKKEDYTLHEPTGYDLSGGYFASDIGSILGYDYEFKTKSQGWFGEKEYLTYIPAITRDFHKDFNLFCKWKQRRYRYTGLYKYAYVIEDTWPSRSDGAGVENIDYYTSSTYVGSTWAGVDNCLPNCTAWVQGRVCEVSSGNLKYGDGPVIGSPGTYVSTARPRGWLSVINTSRWHESEIPVKGGVVVWDGHVAFIESTDGTLSGSVLSGSYYTNVDHTSSMTHERSYYGYTSASNWMNHYVNTWGYDYRWYNNYNTFSQGALLGYIAPNEAYWQTGEKVEYQQEYRSGSAARTWECGRGGDSTDGTQDNPLPSTAISTSQRRVDQRWDPLVCITDCRYSYYDGDELKWTNWTEETRADNSDIRFDDIPMDGYNGWLLDWT